jgi:hypothetical protein
MEAMPMCKRCRTRPATGGEYCEDCSLEVVEDILDGDILAAYEEGIITAEDFRFFEEEVPLTEADIARFNEIMKKIDGE